MWPTLILCGLAAAQLTYLVVDAVILDGPRWHVLDKAPDSIQYLVSCPWCSSFWLSTATVAVARNHIDLDLVAVFAVWWIACLAYFALQAIANRAEP